MTSSAIPWVKIKSQSETIKGLLGIIALVAVCVFTMGQSQPQRIAEADQFILRDQSGQMRARLFMNQGGASLAFYDAHGKGQAALAMSPHGPMLVLNNEKGGRGLELYASGVEVYDENGKLRVNAGYSEDAPRIVLNNSQGKPGATMIVDSDGAFVTTADSNGTARARMCTTKAETSLRLGDGRDDRVFLYLNGTGSALQLFDEAQNARASLIQQGNSTSLGLLDSQQHSGVVLGQTKGLAQLVIRDESGKTVTSLPK